MLHNRRHLVEVAITLQQLDEVPRTVGGSSGTQCLGGERLGEPLEASETTGRKSYVMRRKAPLH